MALVLVSSFFIMVFSARQDSVTVDELVHISAGYLHTWKGNFTFNSEHPPLLNDLAGLFAQFAHPNISATDLNSYTREQQWQFGDLFFYQSGNNVENILFWARLPFILLTLGLIYLVFIWAKDVYGAKAGLVAAILTAFCPNILAHGRLATTDLGLAFFFVLAAYLLRQYFYKPNLKTAFNLGLGLALVVLAKFSGLIFLPIFGLGMLIFILVKKPNIKVFFTQLAVMFLVAFAVFYLVYLFSMRAQLTGNWLMAPFNKFFEGYEILREHNEIGHWNYINGLVDYKGWWYYFPLVIWYKLTIPSLILFGLAILYPKYYRKYFDTFLIVVSALLFFRLSMTSKINIGIRHILVVLPFVYIFISRLAESKNIFLKPLVAALVVLHIVAGVIAYPNYIAYFNEIAGGSKGGLKHLADSNIDWNQNMIRFAQYARKNNINHVYELCWSGYAFKYYGIDFDLLPTKPVKGVVVICAQQLVVVPPGFDIKWVTEYQPDTIIGNGMYVWRFDLKKDFTD